MNVALGVVRILTIKLAPLHMYVPLLNNTHTAMRGKTLTVTRTGFCAIFAHERLSYYSQYSS